MKEENITLYRVGFIREWLQTSNLNPVILLQLENWSFFFYLKQTNNNNKKSQHMQGLLKAMKL